METQNWKQLASIQIGGVICLPVILIGQALSSAHGFFSACYAILLGNLILFLLSCVTASMSFEKKKTTVQNAEASFGKRGMRLFAIAMLAVMIGWFGIQLDLISISVLDLLHIEPTRTIGVIINLLLGILLTFVGMFGLRALTLLSDLSLPVLCGTLAYALYVKEVHTLPQETTLSFGGVSLAIAAGIAAVIDLPTYFRHAQSKKDAYLGAFFTFGLALPAMELIGVYLSIGSSAGNVLSVLQKEGNLLWNIWIALFFILAGWTTNNTNLYSGAISLQTIFPNWTHKNRIWIIGGAGTLLASLNILHHLALFLDLLGIMIISIGGVVLHQYLLKSRFPAITAAIGICLGGGSLCNLFSLSSIPVLDAFLGVSLTTIIIHFTTRGKIYEATHS